MQSIKSYTDIEQSKKLAEILPLESADMNWHELPSTEFFARAFPYKHDHGATEGIFPCWSLAALLSVFPYYEINNNGVNIQLSVKGEALITEKGEYLLDLAVNMIIRLNELNLL